jgi:hypothetical protein
MAGVDEFATELTEHAFVEVVLGEHASAPAIAGFEQNRLRAVLLKAAVSPATTPPTMAIELGPGFLA